MPNLRAKLIRTAYHNPELRAHLLPLLRAAGKHLPAGPFPVGGALIALIDFFREDFIGTPRFSPLEEIRGAVTVRVRVPDPDGYGQRDGMARALAQGGSWIVMSVPGRSPAYQRINDEAARHLHAAIPNSKLLGVV